jgi:hypothetical protein
MTVPEMLSPSERAGINAFLNTPLGVKWLATLMTLKPKVTIDKGIDSGALSGAYLGGYMHLLDEIIPGTRTVLVDDTGSKKPIDMVSD